jgi:hypothetical protein
MVFLFVVLVSSIVIEMILLIDQIVDFFVHHSVYAFTFQTLNQLTKFHESQNGSYDVRLLSSTVLSNFS